MKLTLILLSLLSIIGVATAGSVPVLCADVTTDSIDNITPEEAYFYGTYTGTLPAEVWFIYGGKSNTYAYRTDVYNLTSGTTFSIKADSGFYSNRTLYVRAGSACGYGSELSFNVTNASIVMNTSFGDIMEAIIWDSADPLPATGSGTGVSESDIPAGPFDAGVLAGEVPKAYYDSFGAPEDVAKLVFWGFIILMVFVILYIRSENVTTPALLGMIIGWVLMSFVPGEWAQAGEALLVIAIGAMGFMIVKGRIR